MKVRLELGVILILFLSGCTGGAPLEDVADALGGDAALLVPDDAVAGSLDTAGDAGDARPTLSGRVVDAQGRPVANASVWLEPFDLGQAGNNAAEYDEARAGMQIVSEEGGAFAFVVTPGNRTLMAAKAGHHANRVGPLEVGPAGLSVEIPLPESHGRWLVAHRGGALMAPENTLAAIRKAALAGVDAVEFDVRRTADGALVLMHDATVDRTTDGSGAVSDLTLEQVLSLDAGSWFDASFGGEGVPTFSQALTLAQSLGLAVVAEVKGEGPDRHVALEEVLSHVAAAGAQDRTLVTSFEAEIAAACSRAQAVLCGWLVREESHADAAPFLFRDTGLHAVLLRHNLATGERVAAVKAAGMAVFVWTVNEDSVARRVLALDVDAVATDDPLRMVPILAAQARSS